MSKKNCGQRFGSEAEAFRRRQIVKDTLEQPKRLDLTSGRIIKKAEELVSRKQNNGGRFFVVANGHDRHPDQ